jgi:rhodanese-related sulfurtransferase
MVNAVNVARFDPEVLRALLEAGAPGLHVLDTRPRADYEVGHIPGSLHCPVHELSRREKDLPPRTSRVIVVGEPGRRGDAAGVFLVLAGFAFVAVLEGSFAAWTGVVETGPGLPLDSWRPVRPSGWTKPPAATPGQ